MEKLNESIASVTGDAISTVHGCAPDPVTGVGANGNLKKCENITSSSENAQFCYCYSDTALCNDITKCTCNPGHNYTPYAYIANNTKWAKAENGASHQVVATALATVLSAIGVFWLL